MGGSSNTSILPIPTWLPYRVRGGEGNSDNRGTGRGLDLVASTLLDLNPLNR